MRMANGFEFRIEVPGIDDLLADLDRMPEDLEANLTDAMTEYGLLLEEGARELVHYDGGDLLTSLEFKPLKKLNGAIEGAVGSELQYAMRRHEEPYRPGTHDKYDNGVKFVKYYLNGRGRRTLRKPNWRGLKPGRKFLERASVATEEDFAEIMGEAYDKTLRGRGG